MEKMYVERPVFGMIVADRAENGTFQGSRGRPSPTLGPRGTVMRATDDPGEGELQVGVPWGWRLSETRPTYAIPMEETEPVIRRFLRFADICGVIAVRCPLLGNTWFERIMSHNFHQYDPIWRQVPYEHVIEDIEAMLDAIYVNERKRKGIEDV
jgi:hypothetical protein